MPRLLVATSRRGRYRSPGEVLALDIQDGMLARVREKVRAAGLENVRCLQAGLGEGKLAHAYYHRATLLTVPGESPFHPVARTSPMPNTLGQRLRHGPAAAAALSW